MLESSENNRWQNLSRRGIGMLIETLVVFALITPISAWTAWSLRGDVEKKWYLLILYFGPIIDAWFVWLLMDWLGFDNFAQLW